jgi:hypothetical protein
MFDKIRKEIKETAAELKSFKSSIQCPNSADKGEVIANLTLAYRHLEDASMRMGKAIQAYDGGVSVYDKETTVGC